MTRENCKVAVIQMVSSTQVEHNIQRAQTLLREAKAKGAEVAILPEYWPIMGRQDIDKLALAEIYQQGPLQQFLSKMAKELEFMIVGGTIPLVPDLPHLPQSDLVDKKILNTCLVYDALGHEIARYDKIHLFGFKTEKESYQESETIVPGVQTTSFSTPWGAMGLSICYDLRFPELYRRLLPCDMMVVVAAFTNITGMAHWEILLRSRAIENQCYVLASGQGGVHENGRHTYGRSMIIDPWGKILACLEQGEGVLLADIELSYLKIVRASLPALSHIQLC